MTGASQPPEFGTYLALDNTPEAAAHAFPDEPSRSI
jgi:hypothetical protein